MWNISACVFTFFTLVTLVFHNYQTQYPYPIMASLLSSFHQSNLDCFWQLLPYPPLSGLLWQLYSQSSVDHIQTSSTAHLGSLQLKGKLRLGPCRLHLLVVGRLLQLEVPLNRFDVHNKRNYPGIIYSVSQKKLQTELGPKNQNPNRMRCGQILPSWTLHGHLMLLSLSEKQPNKNGVISRHYIEKCEQPTNKKNKHLV